VVASEVKNLASQTARSTEDINRRIAEIQSVTGAAVSASSNRGRSNEPVRGWIRRSRPLLALGLIQ
jgi:methyl-accepting chemotaxis protein